MTVVDLDRRTYDIVTFGIAAVDDIVELREFPLANTKAPITSIERLPGGQSSTALVAAARQGLRCAYAGMLGHNELSDFTRKVLERENINLVSEIRYPNARPCYSIILLDHSNGERTILYFSDSENVIRNADISETLIADSRILLVDQVGPEGTLRACQLARDHGTQVIADFERVNHPQLLESLQFVDHLILPLRLVRDLTGCNDAEAALRALAKTKRACTAATDGSSGCWFIADHEEVQHQPAFDVEVVDTTGCGDVFHGAYAAAIIQGYSIADSMRRASAAAALSATRRGGQAGIPDLAAIDELLTNSSNVQGWK